MPELNNELSEREREILKLVATGASNKEIAQQLSISANTVKVHLRNIFAKIGTESRTGAAMYAVQHGLAEAQGAVSGDDKTVPADIVNEAEQPEAQRRGWRFGVLWGMAVVIVLALTGWLIYERGTALRPPANPTPQSEPRWQARAEMLSARQGLGVAAVHNQIYAMGGETAEGVSAAVERYDPVADSWEARAAMPVAAADIAAGVVGGLIYIPGGRQADGKISRGLQIYDPEADRWSQGADIPVAVAGYALAALEGRLYLFGGWDGVEYTNRAWIYDPEEDAWSEGTPAPTERAFSGAAVVDGKIYVLGGRDKGGPLQLNEVYQPTLEAQGAAWGQGSPLPAGRYALGVADVVDIIYLIGGVGAGGEQVIPLEYIPRQDRWLELDSAPLQPLSRFGVVLLETSLYLVGGRLGDAPTAQNLAYQAIYTISLPSVVK
ncbi:MAG: LuxR C-terminal-related transcriptional regulator [Chloroflexi bacterium]|nr:LuxR C-terminal-related transcriptional regulator [Chloroflexota bacterium]